MKETFHVFLLAGQSNMAGRGEIEAEDRQPHPRVLMLSKDGVWQPAVDPIHYDKPSAGVGPGRTFGMVLAEADTNTTIGLIPAACGGSPISTWEPGAYFDQTDSHPYDDAIQRAKLAMKQGTLKGILWHQGESDAEEKLAPVYKARLEQLIVRFRKDLDSPDLPFIMGQLGQFEGAPWTQYTRMVNDAQIEVAQEMEQVEFVSSDGLASKGDHLHFDTGSQHEFGKRYAAAYLKTQQSH
ncbi:MAG TPA: sialate O-acetylesterase [Verrucomicrobiae bacterium]|nr:sialate O-acetylesterase [Verrucomicrobiae bacterium]